MRCPIHQQELEAVEDILLHLLEHQIAMEAQMTSFANDQAHLDSDVSRLANAFSTGIAELKQQIANGVPPQLLDFSKLDSLVGTVEAEAAADAIPPGTARAGAVVEAPTSNTQANTGQAVVDPPVVDPTLHVPAEATAASQQAPTVTEPATTPTYPVTEAPAGGTTA